MTTDTSKQSRGAGHGGSFMIFCVGFFTLAAQTLLFRDFLNVFEGSELAIGLFFGLWLFWIGGGALCARTFMKPLAKLRCFELFPLLYIPAFMLAHRLLVSAHEICRIETWEVFPFARLLVLVSVALVPVSFLTGVILTLACKWKQDRHDLPVAAVYMLEVAGSFAGGVLVTIALWQGMQTESIFFWSVLALSVGSAAPAVSERRIPFAVVVAIVAILFPAFGIDSQWADKHNRTRWTRLMGQAGYLKSFSTPHARYSYGVRNEQFVVISRMSVIEAVPDKQRGAHIAAMAIAQKPHAGRILVAGDSVYPICRRILKLPSVTRVTWLGEDPQYPSRFVGVLPEQYGTDTSRLSTPIEDPRKFLRGNESCCDLAILAFSDPTTLHANRYYTRECFEEIKHMLSPGGVVCISISGGENYLGRELGRMGASIYHTLKETFGHVAIKHGEETFLFASTADCLSESPDKLAVRFKSIRGSDRICPPEIFETLFVPDRIERQRQVYLREITRLGGDQILNTDTSPRTLAFALQVTAKKGNMVWVNRYITYFTVAGRWILALGLLIGVMFRLLYRYRQLPPGQGGLMRFRGINTTVLVMTAGAAGMGLNVVLMCRLQGTGGSLFLFVGLVSALFMLGLAIGTLISGRIFSSARKPIVWIVAWMTAHLIVLVVSALLPAESDMMVLSPLFLIGGIFCAGYIPVAAKIRELEGMDLAAAGSNIEVSDHIGGAIGGVVVGLMLVPTLGTGITLLFLGTLLSTNLFALIPVERLSPAVLPPAVSRIRACGWTMSAIVVFVLSVSLVISYRTGPADETLSLRAVFRDNIGTGTLKHAEDSGDFKYLEVTDVPGGDGYFFTTSGLADDIYGYRGPIHLALLVTEEGVLQKAVVINSREDGLYFDRVRQWIPETLEGKNIFQSNGLEGIDGVSGATVSANAVVLTAQTAGNRFAEKIGLGSGPEAAQPVEWSWIFSLSLLAVFSASGLVMRKIPSRRWRIMFLIIMLFIIGVLFNIQYSSRDVTALCNPGTDMSFFRMSLILPVSIPLIVILFGNIFCGWICPFGALQELAGELRPGSLALDPPDLFRKYGQCLKYLMLFVILAGLTRGAIVLQHSDPLAIAFAFRLWTTTAIIVPAIIVAISFFYRRFWCRYLCPAGAFLSIFNGVKLIRPMIPRVYPGRCDMGVQKDDQLDCICCDRCRSHDTSRTDSRPAWTGPVFVIVLIVIASLLVMPAWNGPEDYFRTENDPAREKGAFGPVDTRKHQYIDRERIERLIRQGRISGREAKYYHDLETEKNQTMED